MKAKNWVAILATGSLLAVAAPVSAQFGGLGALKKKLETVAKELEKPKPAPQPQPTARPTPPQSRPETSQGGYASPAPAPQPTARPTPPQAPATPVVRQAVANEVAAIETWRCFGESDATPIKLEFSYYQNKNALRSGTVRMIHSYEYDENSNYAPRNEVEAGVFRSNGFIYNLKFNNNEIGKMDFEISNDRFGGGDQSAKSRYTGYGLMEDIKHLNQIISQEIVDQSEDFGGDTNAISCRIVKPIYSKYSFEEFSIDNPETIFESYREKPKKPNFSYRDKEFGPIGSELYKSIVKAVSDDDYEMPSFAKYYITVYEFGHHYLIDSRDGKVHHLTGDINNDPNIVGDIVGQSISILFNPNSNVVISITKDDSICQINYSKWDGSKLKIFDKQTLGEVSVCVNEGGYDRENLLQLLEDQIIRGERRIPEKTAANASVPVQANASKAPLNSQIVSTEVWNCFSDESPKPIRFELNYTSTQKKNEQGSFREISPFDNEGIETRTPNISSGSFRYEQTHNGDVLKLEYADQSEEYRSFTSSVLDDGVRFGEMDNLQCELVK